MSGEVDGDELSRHRDFTFHDDLLPTEAFSPRPSGQQDFMREFLDESTLTMDYWLSGGDDDGAARTTLVTPNFSMSSTSVELGGEEDSGPCSKKKERMGEEEKHAKGSEFKKV